jgi:adenosylhomocysteine nucleosidase
MRAGATRWPRRRQRAGIACTAHESAALCAALPDALAVEMEGAAVAQVCHDFARPFAVMRTISDRADDGAAVDFAGFVADVASALTRAIVRHALDGDRAR